MKPLRGKRTKDKGHLFSIFIFHLLAHSRLFFGNSKSLKVKKSFSKIKLHLLRVNFVRLSEPKKNPFKSAIVNPRHPRSIS